MPPINNAVPKAPPASPKAPAKPPASKFAGPPAAKGQAHAGATSRPVASQAPHALMKQARATNTPIAKHETHSGVDTHTHATATSMTRFKTDTATGVTSTLHVAKVSPPPNPVAQGFSIMAAGFAKVAEGAGQVAGAAGHAATDALGQAAKAVEGTVDHGVHALAAGVSQAAGTLKHEAGQAAGTVTAVAATVDRSVQSFAQGVDKHVQDLKDTVGHAVQAAQHEIGHGMAEAQAGVKQATDTVGHAATDFAHGVDAHAKSFKDGVETAAKTFKGDFKAGVRKAETDVQQAAATVQHAGQDFAHGVDAKAREFTDAVGRSAETFKHDFAAGVDAARQDVTQAFDALGNTVKGAVTHAANDVLQHYDPADEIKKLKSDGDSATFAYKGSVKVGVGSGKALTRGGLVEGGGGITVTKKGGDLQPGTTSPKPKAPYYEVKATHTLKAGAYADVDPSKAFDKKTGAWKAKVGAEGSLQGTRTETYRFNTEAEAIEATRTLQRNEVSNMVTPGKPNPDPATHGLGEGQGFLAPPADAQARLQAGLYSTSESLGVQVKGTAEGKIELNALGEIPPGLKDPEVLAKWSGGIQPGAEVNGTIEHTWTRAEGKPGEKDYKPPQVHTTLRGDFGVSNKAGVQQKVTTDGLAKARTPDAKAAPVEVGVKETRTDEGARITREFTTTQDLTPAEAKKMEERHGGTFAGQIYDPIPPPDRPASSMTFKATNLVSQEINPTNGQNTFERTEITTVVKPPFGNGGDIAVAAGNTFFADKEAMAEMKAPNISSTVDQRTLVRSGAEYNHEGSIEASGVFEVKASVSERISDDHVVRHTVDKYHAETQAEPPKAEAYGQKLLNNGSDRAAYNNIEAQLVGVGARTTQLHPDKPDAPGNTLENKAAPMSSGTSPWALARVSEGRNHGHPTIAAANSVNAVLRGSGALKPNDAVANTTEARQKLQEAFANATPGQRAEMAQTLSNGIGEDWGVLEIAAENARARQEPAAKHFRDPFLRAEVQDGDGGRTMDPARPDNDPRRYGPAR